MEKLSPNQIVKIRLDGLCYTEDGFSTVCMSVTSPRGIRVYEFIDLVTYPSFNDFHGKSTVVFDSDVAMIIRYVGRPKRVSRDPSWFKYDVYDILINGEVRQMFRQNLIPAVC